MPLTDVKIRNTKPTEKPLKLTDSGGLHLEVRPNGSRLWRYRYKINGKENLFALGDYPTLSLQDARKARDDARELVKQGIHPSHARAGAMSTQVDSNADTFERVAREWLDTKRGKWTDRSLAQATHCIEQNAYPKIGRLPIRSVTAAHLLDLFKAMEKRGAETYAIQLRQWCSAIFRYAIITLRADADPAAALKGAINRPAISHAKAMNAEVIAELRQRLDVYTGNPTTVLAIKLMLYTFVRTNELRKAAWQEFDTGDAAIWTIQAGRMKMRRTHVVPLSRQSLSVLTALRELTGDGGQLFPNVRRPGDVMSSTTINRAFEYMGYDAGVWTGHDFRATASTQLHEMGYRPDIIERQLAHVEGNKTRAAYNHAEYMQERRAMMQAWADWVDGDVAQMAEKMKQSAPSSV